MTSGREKCLNPVGFRDNTYVDQIGGEAGQRRGVPSGVRASIARPCSTRSRPSPKPSARASRPTSRTSTGRSSRWSTCPRRSRARCSRATRATRARCGGCSSTSSPTRRRDRSHVCRERRRGPARGRALRAHLPRLRRRLRGPARRRARRLRVGLQRPHQGAAAPAAGRLPRAVHALHPLRRADARRRLPLLPRPRARSRTTSTRWTRCSTRTRSRCRASRRGSTSEFPGRGRARAPPRDPGQGARPPARPAARRLAVAHGHLRQRPDLRAAHPAPARPPAARGAPLRADDPRGGRRP